MALREVIGINITKNTIVRHLYKYLKDILGYEVPVIPTEQISLKGPYPYVTYSFIAPYIPFRGEGNFTREIVDSDNPNYSKDIIETRYTQPHLTMTFNAYAADKTIAYEVIKKVVDFFEHAGKQTLLDDQISVINVMAFGDRTINIVDHYEHRIGFDVELRRVDKVKRRIETIEIGEMKFMGNTINLLGGTKDDEESK